MKYLVIGLVYLTCCTSFAAEIPLAPNADTAIHEGTLEVPLDWFDRSNPQKLSIKYRIIGYQHTDRPYLFFIGGGPGMESISSAFIPEIKTGKGLAEYFRIFTFDQRGIGTSSPLQRKSPLLTPEIVARYFSAPQIAKDLGYLISRFGNSVEFTLMAHSAGGYILSQYVSDFQAGPRPQAVVYAASTLGSQPQIFATERFRRQIEMNRSVMTPEMKRQVAQIRRRTKQLIKSGVQIPEFAVDILSFELENPKRLALALKQLAEPNMPDDIFVQYLMGGKLAEYTVDPIIKTLSAVYQFGSTDLELAEGANSLAIDEKPWMVLERRFVKSLLRSKITEEKLGPATERSTRIAARKYSQQMAEPSQVRGALARIPTLALVAGQDLYINAGQALSEFKGALDAPHHWVETIDNGNHHSPLDYRVAPFIWQKLMELRVAMQFASCEDILDKFQGSVTAEPTVPLPDRPSN